MLRNGSADTPVPRWNTSILRVSFPTKSTANERQRTRPISTRGVRRRIQTLRRNSSILTTAEQKLAYPFSPTRQPAAMCPRAIGEHTSSFVYLHFRADPTSVNSASLLHKQQVRNTPGTLHASSESRTMDLCDCCPIRRRRPK